MSDSFFAYLQQLELMAFFSGYPLLYAVTVFFTGRPTGKKNNFIHRIDSLLPFAYALVGTLFLGFQLNKFYPGYSVENIKKTIQYPWLTAWALLSTLFWIPAPGKTKVLSLVHSLVFFFFIIKDLYLQLTVSAADGDMVRNDMRIYTESLLLNLIALTLIVFISFLLMRKKKYS